MPRVRPTALRLLAALVSLAGFVGCLGVAQWLGDQQTGAHWSGTALPVAPIGVFTSAQDAAALAAVDPSAIWAARVMTGDSSLRVGIAIGRPADLYVTSSGGPITQGVQGGALAKPITVYMYLPADTLRPALTPLQANLYVDPWKYGPDTGCASWRSTDGSTGSVAGTMLVDEGWRTLVRCDIPALPRLQGLEIGYEVIWTPRFAQPNFAGRWAVAVDSLGEAVPFTDRDSSVVPDPGALRPNDITVGVLTLGSTVLEDPLVGVSSGIGPILQSATVRPADALTLSFRDEGRYRRSEILVQASWIIAGLLVSYVPYWLFQAHRQWRRTSKASPPMRRLRRHPHRGDRLRRSRRLRHASSDRSAAGG